MMMVRRMLTDADRKQLIRHLITEIERLIETPGYGEVSVEIAQHQVHRVRIVRSANFRQDVCRIEELLPTA
jgi:hypothetical protein